MVAYKNFLSHQMEEKQVHWNCFHPNREPEQCLMVCSLDSLDPSRVCPTATEEGSFQEGEASGWER